MELNTLIVDDISEIKYENIKNYVIKESVNVYEHYITYYHESTHYGYFYYEFNNEIIGMIVKNKDNGSIENNMIYNTETKCFYFIKINEENADDDEIKRYTKKQIPEKLKNKTEIFINYYQLLLKKKKKIEIKDKNPSIKKQNSFSQNAKLSEKNSLSNENSARGQNRVIDKSKLIYVRKIISYKEDLTILFLSDKTVEAIFKDKIKILISESKDKIQIIDQDNKINVISAINIFNNPNYDFSNRIKFIKKAMINDIKSKTFNINKENIEIKDK